jgi:hypothetical protein
MLVLKVAHPVIAGEYPVGLWFGAAIVELWLRSILGAALPGNAVGEQGARAIDVLNTIDARICGLMTSRLPAAR